MIRKMPVPGRFTAGSRASFRPALLVAATYAVAGATWILVSGWLLDAALPTANATLVEVLRGLGFVAVTGVALYVVLGRMTRELADGSRMQASLAAQLSEQSTQQRRLSQRLLQAEEETRRAIAKDLHDGPLQALTLSFMRLDAAVSGEGDTAPVDPSQVRGAMSAIREASEEIRSVVKALHPPLLAELGLSAALQRHCQETAERTGRDILFNVHGQQEGDLAQAIPIAIFRVTQEAISNAVRHTSGGPITVNLRFTPERIQVCVEDRGPGFSPSSQTGVGLGLLSMSERTESIGGALNVRSTAHGGTSVQMEVPVEPVAPAG